MHVLSSKIRFAAYDKKKKKEFKSDWFLAP